jgi:hypothetical protein
VRWRSPAPYRRGEESKFWRISPIGQLNDALLVFFPFFSLASDKNFHKGGISCVVAFGNLEYGKRNPGIWVVRLVIIQN